MNFKLMVLTLLFVGFNVKAQDTLRKHQLQFSLNSFTISDVPRYSIGYFYTINKKYKVGATIGYGSNTVITGSVGNKTWTEIVGKPKQDYQVFEFRPEIQKHFRIHKKTPHFIGLQAQYLNHTDRLDNGVRYITSDENYVVRAKSGDFSRTKLGLLFVYGMQIHFNEEKSFGIIPKIGVGIKNRYVKYDNLVDPITTERSNNGETQMFIYFDDAHSDFYEYSGTVMGFDMNLDISVFYRF